MPDFNILPFLSVTFVGITFITTVLSYQQSINQSPSIDKSFIGIPAIYWYVFFYFYFLLLYCLGVQCSLDSSFKKRAVFSLANKTITLDIKPESLISFLFEYHSVIYIILVGLFIHHWHKSHKQKVLSDNCPCPAIDSGCPLK